MLDTAVLKHRPADFLVRENMVVTLTGQVDAAQHYLVLRKCGYTTMEAVRLIAGRLGLSTKDVTYGGLKDEDGITEQLVAVPNGVMDGQLEVNGWALAGEPDRWLRLHHYGFGAEPLRVGRLEGNGFRVVVRNLDAERAAWLEQLRKVNLFFLNYYDTQRFGVPGGPKRTHLVGAAMLDGDWDLALRELADLCAPESPQAAAWTGSAEEFFRALDPRTASFYLAANASSAWNAALREVVGECCPDEWFPVTLEGLTYHYVTSAEAAVRVLAKVRDLPYSRYTFEDGHPEAHESHRPTVVQTTVAISRAEPDDLIEGKSQILLNFFLPSGCYATAAVRQLLAHR